MPSATTSDAFELPATIAGLWSLCPLVPFPSRGAYEEAAALCGRLAVRRLNSVQREYFRELTELVEAYEDVHGEQEATHAKLKKLAGK